MRKKKGLQGGKKKKKRIREKGRKGDGNKRS